MKLLAPVNTFDSAKNVIMNGADEIYLGADDKFFSSYSFTGRGKYSFNGLKVLNHFEEVAKIVDYAHSMNVRVNFLCNTQFLTDNDSKDFEKAILAYISEAISIKVDSIVIGDIGLLYLLSKKELDVPLHASLYFRTVNVEQIKFLRELGVVRTTLSYLVSLDDIKQLVEANIMEIEVPGFLGCSFYNGACSCLHSLGEGVFDDFDQGIICKSRYEVDNITFKKTENIFDNELGCSLCSIKELDTIGVTALKIVGRDRSCDNIREVISTYRKAIDGELKMEELPKSWKMIWCRNNRCKFVNEERMKYYV